MGIDMKLWMMAGCAALMLGMACGDKPQPQQPQQGFVTAPDYSAVQVPAFNADSAYAFVEKQVSFGPRVPGSNGHMACRNWLISTLKRFSSHVLTQDFEATAYTGTKLKLTNIMARWNPEVVDRIVLFAHWDTRHLADMDSERTNEPIAGADDGGSGVAVLLEIMRTLAADSSIRNLGVDIVLFDGEDYGEHGGAAETFCLGSQFWARQPHIPGYSARYGILLDMVGASDAIFMKEGYSVKYASHVVEKVWSIAHEVGAGRYFSPQRSQGHLIDDHYFVNSIMQLPTIDIINYADGRPGGGFGSHWHTHQDNLEIIDKQTLEAVGRTLLTLISRENHDI